MAMGIMQAFCRGSSICVDFIDTSELAIWSVAYNPYINPNIYLL